MIYFNHAATSYPKPDCVREAFLSALSAPPSGQFRSSASGGADEVFSLCRKKLKTLLGVSEPGQILFTSGATESLNAILFGLQIPADRILTTATEHNSVLRPLYNLRGIAGTPGILPCDKNALVDPADFENAAKSGKYRAFVLNHCSNVTGAVQDAATFGRIAKQYDLLFLLDASQSAGAIPIEADRWEADAIAFTGHKSLFGLQGTGGFFLRRGIPFIPYRFGGTGLDSRRIRYEDGDYEFETGTQNAPGLAALSAAVGMILEKGLDKIRAEEQRLADHLLAGLSEIPGLTICGKDLPERGPLISLTSKTLPPSDLAYILQNSYGIITRAGLQCAPLIHDFIGTGTLGTLRISFSFRNTLEEADMLLAALREIF